MRSAVETLRKRDRAHPPLRGIAGLKALAARNNASFAGWHLELHDQFCDGDRIAVRWRGRGRHVGSFMGETPTQKDIELTGISIYRVEDGRIAADWVEPDTLGFLTRLGIVQPPDMAR